MAEQFFPPIRLRWLVCYNAVVEERCYAKAASRLALTPETVSRDVRELTRVMRLPMVQRGRPLRFTSAHLTFLDIATTVVERFLRAGFSEKQLRGNLDLRLLHTLMIVADSNSQGKAGRICNLDQSAISRQLRVLCDWAGKDLFTATRPHELTSDGHEILALATETINLMAEALKGQFDTASIVPFQSQVSSTGYVKEYGFSFFINRFVTNVGFAITHPIQAISAIRNDLREEVLRTLGLLKTVTG